tara:strand:- start:2191 stop:3858 length:1668 start_codon:yes stop_codon:yes gene_type:complete
MSFFNLDDKSNLTTDSIKSIHPGINITSTDILKQSSNPNYNSLKNLQKNIGKLNNDNHMPNNDTFYKINYNSREANFVYSGLQPSQYIANNIYLYGLLHNNISGLTSNTSDIVGEIVFQNYNANNQSRKVYTCFLIQQHPGKIMDNSIDNTVNLITGKSSADFSFTIDAEIKKQTKCIYYKQDENTHVFLYTLPIQVNAPTAEFFKKNLTTSTNIFNIHPSCDPKIITISTDSPSTGGNVTENFISKITDIFYTSKTTETFQEGNENYYMECDYVEDGVEQIPSITTPISSEFAGKQLQIDHFKGIANYLFVIIFALVSQTAIPGLYKSVVIDKIINTDDIKKATAGSTENNTAQSQIIGINTLITILVFGYACSALVIGLGAGSRGSSTLATVGGVLLLIYLISFALINDKRTDAKFMGENYTSDGSFGNLFDGITKFYVFTAIMGFSRYVSWECLITVLVLASLLFLFYYIATNKKYKTFTEELEEINKKAVEKKENPDDGKELVEADQFKVDSYPGYKKRIDQYDYDNHNILIFSGLAILMISPVLVEVMKK